VTSRVIVGVLISALLLAGCSKVKSTVIPSNPKQWDTISDQVKTLDQEDKRLLTAYLMRAGLAAAFTNNAVAIPEGTTIGDAIEQQRQFEAKNSADEAKAEALKAQTEAAQAVATKRLKGLITFAGLGVSILPKDYEVQRYSPQLSVRFVIKNTTGKDIAGVRGSIVLQDIFGSPLKKLAVSADTTIPAGQSVNFSDYVWDLNQFSNDDSHLAATNLDKIKIAFSPQMIVFADGSKEVVPEQ